MAKPKKNEEVLDQNDNAVKQHPVSEKTTSSYSNKTYGIAVINGNYHVLTIDFDAISGQAVVSSSEQTEGKIDAQNRFKVYVARSIFNQQ